MNYGYTGADPRPSGGTLDEWAQFLWTTIADAIQALHTNRTRFLDIVVQDMSPINHVQGSYLLPANTVGDVNQEVSALNVAQVISWRTNQIGRSKRGRTYLGALPEGDVQDGVFTNLRMNLMQGYGLAVTSVSGLPNLHTFPVVASRSLNSLAIVTGWTFDNIPDTQRRRLQGRGS